MKHNEAAAILTALVEGHDPTSGEALPPDSVMQNVSVVRALLFARSALEATVDRQKRRNALPARVGKPWTEDEDKKLTDAFHQQQPLEAVASSHRRTVRAIESRLERLGLITAEQRTTFMFPATIAPAGGGGPEGGPRRKRGRPRQSSGFATAD